jgi:hypothetical protein
VANATTNSVADILAQIQRLDREHAAELTDVFAVRALETK